MLPMWPADGLGCSRSRCVDSRGLPRCLRVPRCAGRWRGWLGVVGFQQSRKTHEEENQSILYSIHCNPSCTLYKYNMCDFRECRRRQLRERYPTGADVFALGPPTSHLADLDLVHGPSTEVDFHGGPSCLPRRRLRHTRQCANSRCSRIRTTNTFPLLD